MITESWWLLGIQGPHSVISGALVFVLLLSAATPGTGTGKFFPAFGPFPKLLLPPDPMSVCLSFSLPLSLTRTHRGTNAQLFFFMGFRTRQGQPLLPRSLFGYLLPKGWILPLALSQGTIFLLKILCGIARAFSLAVCITSTPHTSSAVCFVPQLN